jgi:hypothetical protein
MGIRPDRPYSQIANLITQLGKETVSRARTIFKGHLISVEPLPRSKGSDFQEFVLTYKASEWKKGRRGSHAKLLHSVWCDGGCDSSEIIADFMKQAEERIYLAEPRTAGNKKVRLLRDLDGEISICSYRNSMRPIYAETPHNDPLNHRSFLFLLSITDELEKLPGKFP